MISVIIFEENAMNKLLIFIFLIVLAIPALGKSITEYVQGEGSTREEAIHNALMNGINEFYGVTVGSKVTFNRGQVAENKTIIVRKGEGIKYKVTSIEFTDKYKTDYRAYLKITFQRFTPTEGLWRSAVVPGWGQFYKGSPVKGSIALIGTSGLVVAGILSANHSSEMNDRSQSSRSQYNRDYYHDEATKYHQLSLLFYGVAAGLYALNIFDAVASPLGFSRLEANILDNTRIQFEPELLTQWGGQYAVACKITIGPFR